MIHGFPIPYTDELFYSVVARRTARMGYPSRRALTRDLFGTNSVAGTLEIPSLLASLQQQLPQNHPCANAWLVEATTFLPWYAPFLSRDRVAQLNAYIRYGTGYTCGDADGGVPQPQFLRFCPKCLQEDVSAGREVYWRRLHQLTGVEACPIHSVYLEESQILRSGVGECRRCELPPETLIETAPRQAEATFQVGIAKLAAGLLSGAFRSIDRKNFARAYRCALDSQGFLQRSGRIRLLALMHRFTEVFPKEFLLRIGCAFRSHDPCTWLTGVSHSNTAVCAPLKRLLLMYALNITPSTIETAQHPPSKQMQTSRITCNNPVCPGTGISLVAHSISVRAMRGDIRKCNTCGRITSHSFNCDKKYGIIDYGAVWRATLTNLWNDHTHTLSTIARQLEVDRTTVKEHAFRIGLRFPREGRKFPRERTPTATSPGGTVARKPTRKKMTVHELRMNWLRVMKEHPDYGLTRLSRVRPKLYQKLKQLDEEWLRVHSPVSGIFVDWDGRDIDLSNRIREGADKVRHMLPVKRITSMAICRAAGISYRVVWREWNRLPLCRAAVEETVESAIDVACRRVITTARACASSNTVLTYWQLFHRTKIQGKQLQHKRVRDAMHHAQKMIGAGHLRDEAIL